MLIAYLSEAKYRGILMIRFVLISVFFLSGCGNGFDVPPPEVARKLKPQGNEHQSSGASTGALKTNEICDAEDESIFYKSSSFSNSWGSSARKALGDAQETTNRLRTTYPDLSRDCGDCFGAFAACGASNCKGACWWDHTSAKCEQCGWTYCGLKWEKCTGHPRNKLQRYYYP